MSAQFSSARLRKGCINALAVVVGLLVILLALWWLLFAPKPYTITPEQLTQRYAHAPRPVSALQMRMQPVAMRQYPGFDLRFRAQDGDLVLGRIVYPRAPAAADTPFPVLIAMHGMGRTHLRWWQAEFRDKPTIENTHRLTELALRRGYAVIALDARVHGERKRGFKASDLLHDFELWGKREPYERMIVDSIGDYRTLLDWVDSRPELDAERIGVAGYSMGAQMALLLAAHDPRVDAVAAMVPPHLDDKAATVAPMRSLHRLQRPRVWLLTADDDDYASQAQNAALFAAIPSKDKRHLRFSSGHILPANYVERLEPWF